MYYLVLGNLQCTVHDMKTESELFGTIMIIVLIMNIVYTVDNVIIVAKNLYVKFNVILNFS